MGPKGVCKAVGFKEPNISSRIMIRLLKDMPSIKKCQKEVFVRTREGVFTRCEDVGNRKKAIPWNKAKDRIEKKLIMRVRPWGVRGSRPAPSEHGFSTVKYGGHSTCIVATTKEGDPVIFDVGQGVIRYGKAVMAGKEPFDGYGTIISTHKHGDHLDGLGFFKPIYRPNYEFVFAGAVAAELQGDKEVFCTIEEAAKSRMGRPYFSATVGSKAKVEFVNIGPGIWSILGGRATLRATFLNHPDLVLGYELFYEGTKVVIETDVEPIPGQAIVDSAKLYKGADVVFFDAQYTEEGYKEKVDWGHGSVSSGFRVLEEALKMVGKTLPKVTDKIADSILLIGTHFDPEYSDKVVDRMQKEALGLYPNILMAREDMEIYICKR